jgi:hypothetical protein
VIATRSKGQGCKLGLIAQLGQKYCHENRKKGRKGHDDLREPGQ